MLTGTVLPAANSSSTAASGAVQSLRGGSELVAGVHAGHDGAAPADLVHRDGQRALALFPREGGHLGGVTIGHDAGLIGR